MDISALLDALWFASEFHKDQRRKGDGGSPYVNHLIEVASLLANIANVSDVEVLQAAILHDILEDTKVNENEIAKRYGKIVLEYVKCVTDDKAFSLKERRRRQVQTVAGTKDEVKLIKLADHCSNIISLPPTWELDRLESYLSWSHEVATLCFVASEALADEYKKRYIVAMSLVDEKRV